MFPDGNDKCYDQEFQCKSNKRCISKELVCDYNDDCTDSSDDCSLSTGAIVGKISLTYVAITDTLYLKQT